MGALGAQGMKELGKNSLNLKMKDKHVSFLICVQEGEILLLDILFAD